MAAISQHQPQEIAMNRITTAIATQRTLIAERLANGSTTQERVNACHKLLDMDVEEFCKFQEIKSAAIDTALTLEEANTIYKYLGSGPDHFNKQAVEVKAALTCVFKELLVTDLRMDNTIDNQLEEGDE